jgi:LacI family transcriptional regulator
MGLADSYEHGIARGVVRYAKERGWRLFGYGWMFRPLEAIEEWQGDGIIARVESQADADRIARAGLPVVDVAGAYRGSGFHRATNDDTATGEQAGRYLVSCGFSRFAFSGVRGVGWSERRRQGFREALGSAGRDLPLFEESLSWWESTQKSGGLSGWVNTLRPPVGIFACNDTAGLKLAEMCRLRGLRIPEEAAILGVDNEDILCELALPSLSSIALDLESIGMRAAELLDTILRGRAPARSGAREILVPPKEIVERDSTRTFTCEDPLVESAVRFIRANTGKPLRVSDVVGALPASRRSLELRFRRAVGRTVRDEILRVRLARARALLRTTDTRIADVAAEAGFRSPQRFHALFRAAEGCSPADYRRARPRRG